MINEDMALPAGLQPAAFRSGGERSMQLSYGSGNPIINYHLSFINEKNGELKTVD